MALKKYGVWVAQPTSYDAQTPKQDPKTPHITLQFSGGSAEINVKSTDKDTRLVYWVNKNFSHPITESLASLDPGLNELSSNSDSDSNNSVALDFQRTSPSLLNIQSGTLLDSYESGPNNDILDKLEPILNQAISEKASVYLFGQYYHDSDGVSGIHDIHMNQGNAKGYENAIWSDGSLFVQFGDGHWEAVFLAFATQALPTDERGDPTDDAPRFDQILKSGS